MTGLAQMAATKTNKLNHVASRKEATQRSLAGKLATLVLTGFFCLGSPGLVAPASAVEAKEKKLSADGFLDVSTTDTMGLSVLPVRHHQIFTASEETNKYNHHPHIIYFHGEFYAMWSSGPRDEDSAGQKIVYATSRNGTNWSAAQVLVDDPDGPDGPLRLTAGGWMHDDAHLFAFYTVYEGSGAAQKWSKLVTKAVASGDGRTWKPLAWELPDFIVNQQPLQLEAGRWLLMGENARAKVVTVRLSLDQNGLPILSDPAGLPENKEGALLTEMTAYRNFASANLVALLRDDRGSTRLYSSESKDEGRTWGYPLMTNFPDARAKLVAGNFSGGLPYLVSNPAPGRRIPLALSVSIDGESFSRAFIVRTGNIDVRYAGNHKGPGYQYPSAITANNSLWIIYSISKEDIAVTEVPLSLLAKQMGSAVFLRRSPPPQIIVAGRPADIRLDAAGLDLTTYRWLRNGLQVALTEEPRLFLATPGPADGGRYVVEMTSLGVTSRTNPFFVSVRSDNAH